VIEGGLLSQHVSVIIVNYNSAKLLEAALSGVSRQTYRKFSTLVIDNASIEPLVAAGASGVQVFRLPRNIGFAGASNYAVELCRESNWIAMLNPDAVPADDWLERLVTAAEADPDVACFASRMIQATRPTALDGAGDTYHACGLVWRRGYGTPAEGRYGNKEEVFSACAAAALYRRDIFEAVGGFDEDFFCYLEDVDLGFRLRLAGHRCLYVPDAVVYHVGSATTGKDSDFAIYHGHRNLVWVYVKNMPGALFWLYLPQHIALNVFTIIVYILKGRWRAILQAKWDAIRGLRRAWQKRKAVQFHRVAETRDIGKVLERGLPWRRR
jgi:GT2 family glycosyltransferase